MLIDATMNMDYDPDPDLGGARFPPTVWPAEADVAAVKARWAELGLDKGGNGDRSPGWSHQGVALNACHDGLLRNPGPAYP